MLQLSIHPDSMAAINVVPLTLTSLPADIIRKIIRMDGVSAGNERLVTFFLFPFFGNSMPPSEAKQDMKEMYSDFTHLEFACRRVSSISEAVTCSRAR